jgi:hypothetical protein
MLKNDSKNTAQHYLSKDELPKPVWICVRGRLVEYTCDDA